jgi:hypothetical protein
VVNHAGRPWPPVDAPGGRSSARAARSWVRPSTGFKYEGRTRGHLNAHRWAVTLTAGGRMDCSHTRAPDPLSICQKTPSVAVVVDAWVVMPSHGACGTRRSLERLAGEWSGER